MAEACSVKGQAEQTVPEVQAVASSICWGEKSNDMMWIPQPWDFITWSYLKSSSIDWGRLSYNPEFSTDVTQYLTWKKYCNSYLEKSMAKNNSRQVNFNL